MISAKVIADSINPHGIRLTTMQLEYPRFIHAEFMTHRVFSRGASSSRAVPVKRTLARVWKEPAAPVEWGRNRPGMQSTEPLKGARLALAQAAWHGTCLAACAGAWIAMKAGAHKQVVNRILEPWSHISVVVTATEWANFFALRDHKDADPTMRALAQAMKKAMKASEPKLVKQGEWHLPYIRPHEMELYDTEILLMRSAARCARVSYLRHDGQMPSLSDDRRLYKQLVEGDLVHASPTEHQATPSDDGFYANFRGWLQFRKFIPNEVVR